MSERPRLVYTDVSDGTVTSSLPPAMEDHVELVPANPGDGQSSAGFLVLGDVTDRLPELNWCALGFLDQLPDGMALIDSDERLVWCNHRLASVIETDEPLVGKTLKAALGSPEFMEHCREPLSADFSATPYIRSTARLESRRYLGLRFSRCNFRRQDGSVEELTAMTARDVTLEVTEQQKHEAIQEAGVILGDWSPQDVRDMSDQERVQILKENIMEFTHDLLGFETIEIRLLDHCSGELTPLLADGMDEEAVNRPLFARPEGNGVTGYVAHSQQSYLCRDTRTDPLYLCGVSDARSSVTVPLIMHDEVLGTINVERRGSFDERDLDFLQRFGRVVAQALNQLQLLATEQVATAAHNSQRVRREIARPVDAILEHANTLLEQYIGHDPVLAERLQAILKETRRIGGEVRKATENLRPVVSLPQGISEQNLRPALQGRKILVVDGDESIRDAAHEHLDRQGCIVEGVRDGEQAGRHSRNAEYDVALVDIRLSDMSGYDCFCRLREIHRHIPVILMTGFGYDPSHSIVKARQAGVKSVLYKPFRVEKLLEEVEKAVTMPPPIE